MILKRSCHFYIAGYISLTNPGIANNNSVLYHLISLIFKSKMPIINILSEYNFRPLIPGLIIALIFNCISCQSNPQIPKISQSASTQSDSATIKDTSDESLPGNSMLVLPKNPVPGETFRILVSGHEDILNSQIIVNGPEGNQVSQKVKTGEGFPSWKIEDFPGSPAGKYKVTLIVKKNVVSNLEFTISPRVATQSAGVVWKTLQGWDSSMEMLYSAWINALFYGCSEQASWHALHEVTRNINQNFLYNYLSLDEDNPDRKINLTMQPDCADNPFFLRAYFSWKLGLPFGYHVCDRGSLERSPRPGQWITNEIPDTKTDHVEAFNIFLRRIKDGVQSATARTALDDENSDYYPVPLGPGALRSGVVYADPYGHTLILVGRIPQTSEHPGLLLAVDAQPDGTVGIKRFWKGNFLFNTTGVIGEPGFKAFRPIPIRKNGMYLMHNHELSATEGYIPFSLQQRKMAADEFYRRMERLINPTPLDPEIQLIDLIQALHEQLLVRVTSVANGEEYFKQHPGANIPVPSSAAGIFLAGGQWEDFSTPNRDLRLLIAMDAVLDFPDLVARTPGGFKISKNISPEQVKESLQSILEQKVSELSINYTHTDGTIQKLTIADILNRKDAFEMAYNPNDGIEIRWGAPENSEERAFCRRHAPPNQLEKMLLVRNWFHKRLHPPT
jgi:hypothetical protein